MEWKGSFRLAVFCLTTAVLFKLSSASACAPGWVHRPASTSCYKFMNSRRTWASASLSCRSMGAHLATLETEDEIMWMYGYRGFHSRISRDSWIGGTKERGVWYWTWPRKTPIKHFDWGPGEPNNSGGRLMLFGTLPDDGRSKRMDDRSSSSSVYYICEKESHGSGLVATTARPTVIAKSTCASGWVKRPGSNSCYKFVISIRKSWTSASRSCRYMRAHLATLETEEEIIWMYGYRGYHKRLRKDSFIGGFKQGGRWYWNWPRKTPITTFDWGTGEPSNTGGNQNRLLLFGETDDAKGMTLRFDDRYGGYSFHYICEKAGTPITIDPRPNVRTTASSNWWSKK